MPKPYTSSIPERTGVLLIIKWCMLTTNRHIESITNRHIESIYVITSVIVFNILIITQLTGCNREIIELMPIRDIEIQAVPIDLPDAPDVFAISVLVIGTLSNECIEDYEVDRKIIPHVFDRYPIYYDGDTIFTEIKQTVSVPGGLLSGSYSCDSASPYYIDMIFLGYCKPGEYKIDVNGYTESFSVG